MSNATEVHEISQGETIDGFLVGECIHQSQVSSLYRVTHPEHNEAMIMKVPKISVLLPSSVFAGFETEIRILSRLRGAYTPRVYAKGDLSTCPYLVMEYVEGDLLQQAVRNAPVELEQLCQLMRPVCRAVHELHRHNIIHLDLKPENIRNRDDGHVVVIDMGTAHHAQLPDMYSVTDEQQPFTVDYVAPEQLFGIRTDSRSDIYAIGVMLYELATGKGPFEKANLLTVKTRLYIPPKPPRCINKDIPEWLQEVILKCMEINPENRYSTAKEVAYALAHPNMVELTERATKKHSAGPFAILQNWLRHRESMFVKASRLQPYHRLTTAQHILVTVKLDHSSEELRQSLRKEMQKIARQETDSYFTCLSVVAKEATGDAEDISDFITQSQPRHIQVQAELRHWLEPVKLPQSRLNVQVIYGDPATEIVNYANTFAIDHIIMCAHRSGSGKKVIGQVPEKIIAEVNCSVTVVRTRLDYPEQ
ncbi:MAG: bifunctional serine/threonine-protein kinase/universal stress protein [Gammaproteobacteria bacterium]|nr:bifunctional serine/threonine-protein kinase/universal stress protein [Gammaproteobacteria bacterium]